MADDEAFEDRDDAVASGLPSDFRASVSHALAELGYHAASWEPEGVNALAPDDGRPVEEREHYIGLGNLYRRAKGVEHAEWALMIQEFLQHITGTLTGKIPDDLAAIAERLRPRLGRPFSREAETYPWGVPLPGTGLEINLVVDFPNTMAYVTPAMLKKTRSSAEDLLDRALANLRDATPGDFFEHVSEELDILVGHTGDGYDAARALLIEDLLPESAAGFLVAIPSREELAVWPVRFAAIEKIHIIKLFASENYREHAYPVADDVFWVNKGTWHRLEIKIDGENVTVSPPDEFVVALRELGVRATENDEASPQ